MNFHVLKAIFKRDFISYFSNPTGYVFICVFVVLSAAAAFWPPEFFGNNLANLDQLSRWMPFILLVFIPAITMSSWAEERRRGTDELLLTMPASDLDVVVGKYLAGVAIFTVSLLFSMFSIYLIFSWGLGWPDSGLFIGTYIGYWFIGIAMLSIGMVASFLTNNLTVGFIVGMIFNLPLAIFGVADWIIRDPGFAQAIKRWSASEQFADFERGVISLSGISYFLMIVIVMLYLSMVLIGRRHWRGGDDGNSMWGHYFLRALSLVALAVGVNLLLSHVGLARWDATKERLNSLSQKSIELIDQLRNDDNVPTIKIDAYVSPQVPAEYAALKRNFISSLQELSSLSGGKIQVDLNQIENFSEQATLAERTYGIEPREVDTNMGGSRKREEIYLGAAFTCGLDKVVIPFIDKGIPIEYELVRSIATVAQQERKKLGVLKTDVELFGGFSMQGQTEESRLVTELKKQYEVVEVDPTSPITERFDVMLAVQPSSLTPEKMDNFVAAVRAGQPVAIFEDPFPLPQFFPNVVGTGQPKRPPGGMMGMFNRQPPEPKGDINQLWKLLGVRFVADDIIWQNYNPYKQAQSFIDQQWIFIDEGNGAVQPFNPDNEISEGMRQVLFLIAGGWQPDNNSNLDFTALAVTGPQTGTINYRDFEMQMRGAPMSPRRALTRESYIVAAEVSGTVETEDDLFIAAEYDEDKQSGEEQEEEVKEEANVRAVLVADIDWIAPVIFMLREMGQEEEMLINWNFQNVAFVLNILDHLAEDQRFIDIRKRDRTHRILTKIEEATEKYRDKSLQQTNDFVADAREQIDEAGKEFQDKIDEIEARADLDPTAKRQLLEITRQRLERIRNVKIARLEKDRDRKIRQSERDRDLDIRGVQSRYKTYAVVLPLIPPALVAFFVFFHRRKSEREGVSKSRLRYGGPIDERATEIK